MGVHVTQYATNVHVVDWDETQEKMTCVTGGAGWPGSRMTSSLCPPSSLSTATRIESQLDVMSFVSGMSGHESMSRWNTAHSFSTTHCTQSAMLVSWQRTWISETSPFNPVEPLTSLKNYYRQLAVAPRFVERRKEAAKARLLVVGRHG